MSMGEQDSQEETVSERWISAPPPQAFPVPTKWPTPRKYPGGITTTGYNVINTFTDRCAAAGVLAGFSIAVAAIIVAVTGSTPSIAADLHFKDLSSALIGLAGVLFIASMEFFLRAKENNAWDLAQKYQHAIWTELGSQEFRRRFDQMGQALVASERYGRNAYNLAIVLLFVGMFFVLYPVSPPAAFVVSGGGLLLQLIQVLH